VIYFFLYAVIIIVILELFRAGKYCRTCGAETRDLCICKRDNMEEFKPFVGEGEL